MLGSRPFHYHQIRLIDNGMRCFNIKAPNVSITLAKTSKPYPCIAIDRPAGPLNDSRVRRAPLKGEPFSFAPPT